MKERRDIIRLKRKYDQMEKEPLVFTWARDRSVDCLIRCQFLVQRDHKPLVPILSTKDLADLLPRVLRFRIKLARLSFSIKHVPGKDLVIPDILSHAPAATIHETSLKISKEADGYLSFVISDLLASDQRLEEFRIKQDDDDVCAVVKQYTRDCWPPLHQVKGHTFYNQSCSP